METKDLDAKKLIEGLSPETWYGNFKNQTCKRTSYNTIAGEHKNNKQPFRKNYAGIGMIYDTVLDAFYQQQPYPSWTLDQNTCDWIPPIPRPPIVFGKRYKWNEDILNWEEIQVSE